MYEHFDSVVTLKVIGRQWYWSYEYTDTINLEQQTDENHEVIKINNIFDSYMDQYLEQTSIFNLLKVYNDVYLPVQTHLRILITSTYFIHSWAVPSLVVKFDACPGRLNQISLYI
jgi:cytochrome c oxidase subunit 2